MEKYSELITIQDNQLEEQVQSTFTATEKKKKRER